MMKTRRKSKAAAAAAASQDTATRENSPAVFAVDLPDDINLEALTAKLPDVNLANPSPETIAAVYRFFVEQVEQTEFVQRELEETRADIERKDVELDQAIQDRETATSGMETVLDRVQKELSQVKQEKDALAAERTQLQASLDSLSTTQSSSSVEAQTLRQRVEETEREKRDLMGVVSRLQEDAAQRDTEIQTLRSDLKQARQEHQSLERQVRELTSAETSTKFKLESLTQQLELAKTDAERSATDLAARSEEFAKYRRTKHAELAQLQAAHDSLAQNHASTESTLKALQSAHTSQSHQLTQALTRIQDLKGQLAEQEATYSSEAANLRRLVAMMEDREATTKSMVDGFEKDFASVNERAERREAVLREDIENQRQRAEDAEKRVAELQAVLDRMDRGEFPVPVFAGSISTPGTPARGISTPMRGGATPDILSQGISGLSPTVAMASRAQRGGKSFTEVYSDYVKLQEDFARKCAEYDHMDRTLQSVLAQIEERAPILSQQRAEYERLQSEASQLSSQLSHALTERDALAHVAEENRQKLQKSTRENELLGKQLEDLGRQLRTLLKELGRQQDASIPSDEVLEQDDTTQPAVDIESVITNNLVLFRSIPQLQEQNQKLLKIVRELGARLESEERDYKEVLEQEQREAVQEAHEAIKQLQEQLESHKRNSEVTIDAYKKERDTLRNMLNRQQASGVVSHQANGINGQTAEPSDMAKELEEVQKQFETYRTEMGVDSSRLREESLFAQREASKLNAALAKANAQIEVLTERHRMVQDQIVMQKRENDDLVKRNQGLYDQYTRVDIECNRMSEDLIASNGLLEQLRNECANLRAEKKIWESIQTRLVNENKTLAVERSHLSDLMANVQRMHNDLERSGENDRRRMESQLQLMENQNHDLRNQLTQERESVRRLTLQKDIELKEFQSKVEKATQDLSKTRESLVAAETSKKHLEERVEQLSRQLQGNEEKLAVYERRVPGAESISPRIDEDLSREQQLEAEVAELRAALKVAEVDLAAARSHVQQFQEISQASETALAALSNTHDEYQASTEAELAKRQSDLEALEEKLRLAEERLGQLTQTNIDLQRQFDQDRVAWVNDKKTLEDTIVDMSTSAQNTQSDRSTWEAEIHQQEERAKAAEERYSKEVVAHAEALKAVQELKFSLKESQTAAREARAAAETAQAKLASSECSWQQQREALDKEIADLQLRCKDLNEQNKLLHHHLESVSTRAARIQQAATSTATESGEGDPMDDNDTKLTELRSLVTYLRKEKEIIELQLDLSKQETTRLKTQIDHVSQSLEETRKSLSDERERAVQAAVSEAQHSQLAEKINQVAILRESNATLRSDCDTYSKRARQLEADLRKVTDEVEPVKEQLRVAQAEVEAKDQQIKALESESLRWQERNTQLLTKYDRIDPAEVQSLKDEITKLEAQNAELTTTVQAHAERIEGLLTRNKRLIDLGKENNEKAKRGWASRDAELLQLKGNLEQLTKELEEVKANSQQAAAADAPVDPALAQELETLKKEKASLEQALADERASQLIASAQTAEQVAELERLRKERDGLLTEKATWTSAGENTAAPDAAAQAQWEAEKATLTKARDEAEARAKTMSEEVAKANQEVQESRQASGKYTSRIHDLSKARLAEQEEIKKLRAQLEAATSQGSSDAAAKHAEELRALEERLTKKHEEELKAAVDAAKAQAAKSGVALASPDVQTAVDAALAAYKEEIQAEHAKAIEAAIESGRKEVGARAKLKDQQLIKAQAKIKELEARLLDGVPASPSTSAPTATPSAPPAAAASTSASTAPPAAAAAGTPPAPPKAALPTSLPAKPTPAPGPRTSNVPARGRGAPGRGLSIRGAAPGAGRGAPGAAAALADAAAANAGGAKRTREGDVVGDDAAAKRQKQGGGGPVALRRNRVGGDPPAPQ